VIVLRGDKLGIRVSEKRKGQEKKLFILGFLVWFKSSNWTDLALFEWFYTQNGMDKIKLEHLSQNLVDKYRITQNLERGEKPRFLCYVTCHKLYLYELTKIDNGKKKKKKLSSSFIIIKSSNWSFRVLDKRLIMVKERWKSL
jgi:hypothetical protein